MNDIREKLLLIGMRSTEYPDNFTGTPKAKLHGRDYTVNIGVCMYHLSVMVSVAAPVTVMVAPVRVPITEDSLNTINKLLNARYHAQFGSALHELTGD